MSTSMNSLLRIETGNKCLQGLLAILTGDNHHPVNGYQLEKFINGCGGDCLPVSKLRHDTNIDFAIIGQKSDPDTVAAIESYQIRKLSQEQLFKWVETANSRPATSKRSRDESGSEERSRTPLQPAKRQQTNNEAREAVPNRTFPGLAELAAEVEAHRLGYHRPPPPRRPSPQQRPRQQSTPSPPSLRSHEYRWAIDAEEKLHKAYPNDSFQVVMARNNNPPVQPVGFGLVQRDVDMSSWCYDLKIKCNDCETYHSPSLSSFYNFQMHHLAKPAHRARVEERMMETVPEDELLEKAARIKAALERRGLA